MIYILNQNIVNYLFQHSLPAAIVTYLQNDIFFKIISRWTNKLEENMTYITNMKRGKNIY